MKLDPTLERWRVRSGAFATQTGDDFGGFFVPGPCGVELKIIASNGESSVGAGWEHVSVSTAKRCPNWVEMTFVKDLFWDAEDAVMQLHPPRSRWINNHPYCLHLWRPTTQQIPLPPEITVGIAGVELTPDSTRQAAQILDDELQRRANDQ